MTFNGAVVKFLRSSVQFHVVSDVEHSIRRHWFQCPMTHGHVGIVRRLATTAAAGHWTRHLLALAEFDVSFV